MGKKRYLSNGLHMMRDVLFHSLLFAFFALRGPHKDTGSRQLTSGVLPNLFGIDLIPESPDIRNTSPRVLVLDAWTFDIRKAFPDGRFVEILIRQACASRYMLEHMMGTMGNSRILS